MGKREPEFCSIQSFVEFLQEEERTSFTGLEISKLAKRVKRSNCKLVDDLEKLGFKLEKRPHEPKMRGFKSNDHNRWSSYPSHGGSGIDGRSGVNGEF